MPRMPRQGALAATVLALAAVTLAVTLALALAACDRRSTPSRRPDVFVFVVDALRRDHLDLYGYARATGPRLEAFAADAVVFTNAYATSSWARPSIASLLTGAWPDRHGRDGLASDAFTLPELLGPAGYRSHAFSAHPRLAADPGFAQGFTAVQALADAPANEVVDAALAALATHEPNQPLAFVLHLGDPRGPYAPPREFVADWPPQGPGPWDPATLDAATPAARVADLHAAYDGEVAFVDHELGRFLDGLRAAQRYEDALIVVAGTHGEELQEHGRGGHGRTLFEEVVAVPLVIRFPRGAGAGEYVHGPVSLVDVLPTVLPVVGVRTNQRIDGIDLAGSTAGQGQALRDRALYFFLDAAAAGTGAGQWRAVLQRGDKYVAENTPDAVGALYRLALDPFEQNDVAGAEAARAARLRRALDRVARPPVTPP